MRFSADHYYDEADLYDIRILSTLGLTDSDLEEVRKLDEVEAVMPVHDSDFDPAVFRKGTPTPQECTVCRQTLETAAPII